MKKFLSVILAVAMMATVVMAFAGCSKDEPATPESTESLSTQAGDLDLVKQKGKLVIGMTEYKPMNYKDKKTGEWTGFDTEFAQAVGKKLGVDVEFVEITWENKVSELDSKSVDCLWNGMTITDELKEKISITNPYAENAQVVVMKSDNLSKYKDVESLKELTIAVEGGSAGEKVAKESGLTNLIISDNQGRALTEVTSGSVDACIIDLTMANSMTGEGTSNANLGYELKLQSEEYGIGFRKNSDLTDEVNKIMAELMQDGTLDKLAEKYEIVLVK